MFADDAAGEAVQGADGGGIKLEQSLFRLGCGVCGQLDTDPFAQFRRGFLGECDRGDPVELDTVDQDEPADPLHQGMSFAAACPGLHEQRGGGVLGDAGTRGLVRKSLVGHYCAAPYFAT